MDKRIDRGKMNSFILNPNINNNDVINKEKKGTDSSPTPIAK